MALDPLQVGTTATTILTAKTPDGAVIDISGATLTNAVRIRTVRNKVVRKTPSLYTTGTDGKFAFSYATTDLDSGGNAQVQFICVIGSDSFPSAVLTQPVLENIS